MNTHYLFEVLIVICCCIVSCQEETTQRRSTPKQLSVSTFNQDSIWLKSYQLFSTKVLRPKASGILATISDSTHLPIADVGLFNMLVQNYDCTQLKVQDFQIKYPFANYDFVEDNFNRLVALKLFARRQENYQLTDSGKALLNQLQYHYQQLPYEESYDFILKIYKTVVKNAISEDFTGINKSLQNRQRASLRFENDGNKCLQLLTVMGDLVALRNDQAHYRYELEKGNYAGAFQEFTPPMIEILSGIFHQQTFDPYRYLSRPTWGHDKTETTNFINALLDEVLIEKRDTTYILTAKGLALEAAANAMCETKFYEPWLFIKEEDYMKLKKELQ